MDHDRNRQLICSRLSLVCGSPRCAIKGLEQKTQELHGRSGHISSKEYILQPIVSNNRQRNRSFRGMVCWKIGMDS